MRKLTCIQKFQEVGLKFPKNRGNGFMSTPEGHYIGIRKIRELLLNNSDDLSGFTHEWVGSF